MKPKIFLFFLFVIFLIGTLAPSYFVYAQEAPRYNFGSMQASKSLFAKPGQEIETKLYFYNIYGNRPTHIKLKIVEKPEDWEVSLFPNIHKEKYEVSGEIREVEENLVVYPSNTSEKPGEKTEGKEWISSKVGYINADYVTIKIKIPENEKIGTSENIKINAIAFWLGQTGSIALQQERDFSYTIKTTTEYYEKPYEGSEVKIKSLGKKILDLIIEPSEINPLIMISTGTTLILLIILIILIIIAGKKSKKKKKKK